MNLLNYFFCPKYCTIHKRKFQQWHGWKKTKSDETKIDLPANQTLKDRFVDANKYSEDKQLFYEVKASRHRLYASQVIPFEFYA